MNAMTSHIIFASAYRQLAAAERAFVDGVIIEFERLADRNKERIALMLNRPIPAAIVERSRGMLDRPMVRAAISERVNEISAANDLTVQRMVKEMMSIGFSSIGNYMTVEEDLDGEGQIVSTPVFDLARCTPEQLAAIKSIDVEESGDGLSRPVKRKIKITLHDKVAGLKMLGEFMGMLASDNPYWRASTARDAMPVLPAGATAAEAGDAYAAMIDG